MTLETKEFAPTANDYTRILLLKSQTYTVMLALVLLTITVVGYYLYKAPVVMIVGPIVLLMYLGLTFAGYYRYPRQASFREALLPRRHVFTGGGFQTQLTDGKTSKHQWNNLVKAQRLAGFTVLYFTRDSFTLVPDSAFANAGDAEALRALLKEKGLL